MSAVLSGAFDSDHTLPVIVWTVGAESMARWMGHIGEWGAETSALVDVVGAARDVATVVGVAFRGSGVCDMPCIETGHLPYGYESLLLAFVCRLLAGRVAAVDKGLPNGCDVHAAILVE